MAGIGWRLERLIQRGISGAAAAYATGAAVMALPWVLTTVMLASLPIALRGTNADLGAAGTVVNVAYAVALLVAGPIQIVISRYAADRLYERRSRAIAAPLARGLGTMFLICALAAALALLPLRLPVRAVLWGAVLSAAVGAQWTALSVGNGLCSPVLVLGAVVAGSVLSFLFSALLVAIAGLGVPGYVFGLIVGQILTLVILLIGILRALPDDADDTASLLPAFRDYAPLAAAGLAFNASLWVDKLIAWWFVGGRSAALHAAASTLAWFSAIPCLAWVFVEVETRFYRRFKSFYRELREGASLAELDRGARALEHETRRLLKGAVSVQAGVTLLLQLVVGTLARWLGLPDDAILPYRILLVGAGAQAVGLLGLILLYYFDLRREACLAATGLFVAVAALTTAAATLGLLPSAGTALACLIGAVLTWRSVLDSVRAVLQHTLLAQPFGAERRARSRARRRPGA